MRRLADIAYSEKPLWEREGDMIDNFIEGSFGSRNPNKLHEEERDSDFGDTCQEHRNLHMTRF